MAKIKVFKKRVLKTAEPPVIDHPKYQALVGVYERGKILPHICRDLPHVKNLLFM